MTFIIGIETNNFNYILYDSKVKQDDGISITLGKRDKGEYFDIFAAFNFEGYKIYKDLLDIQNICNNSIEPILYNDLDKELDNLTLNKDNSIRCLIRFCSNQKIVGRILKYPKNSKLFIEKEKSFKYKYFVLSPELKSKLNNIFLKIKLKFLLYFLKFYMNRDYFKFSTGNIEEDIIKYKLWLMKIFKNIGFISKLIIEVASKHLSKEIVDFPYGIFISHYNLLKNSIDDKKEGFLIYVTFNYIIYENFFDVDYKNEDFIFYVYKNGELIYSHTF